MNDGFRMFRISGEGLNRGRERERERERERDGERERMWQRAVWVQSSLQVLIAALCGAAAGSPLLAASGGFLCERRAWTTQHRWRLEAIYPCHFRPGVSASIRDRWWLVPLCLGSADCPVVSPAWPCCRGTGESQTTRLWTLDAFDLTVCS